MAAKKNVTNTSKALQDTLATLEVDTIGIARVLDLNDEQMKEANLTLLPGAKSMAVMGVEVWPEFLDLTSPEMIAGSTNLNDIYQQHQNYLLGKLSCAVYDFAKASRAAGFKALPLQGQGPAVDRRSLHAIISYKHAGEAAGLGRIGMSSLLISEKYGRTPPRHLPDGSGIVPHPGAGKPCLPLLQRLRVALPGQSFGEAEEGRGLCYQQVRLPGVRGGGGGLFRMYAGMPHRFAEV